MPKAPVELPPVLRFGDFEADLRQKELRKHGVRLKLQIQPFEVLALLLERPRVLVTREEIQQKLWPGDTFTDFEHGLHNAMNRLREAMGDSAAHPRFIETIPRRGYRFIGEIESNPRGSAGTAVAAARPEQGRMEPQAPRRSRFMVYPALGLAVFALALLLMGFPPKAVDAIAVPPIRSLVVLPLENLSGDPAQEYFADGITDALITELAHIQSLRVISSTSAMHYKGSKKPLPEIARELRVDAVVEGSVVRQNDRVRVNLQLIHASDDRHLWANQYDRDLKDVLELQTELARAVSQQVQAALTPQEHGRLHAAQRPVKPEAYNAYLLGRYFVERPSRGNLEKALGYYEQAIQLDPNYALAWAGLADTHRFLGGGGFVPAEEGVRKSRAAVERALELDGDMAEAHAAMGSIQMFVDWDWTAADVSYERALALDPGNISAISGAARLAADLGRFEQALQLARRAVERDPLNPRSHRFLGEIARFAGRLDEAFTALNRALELNPQGPVTHLVIGLVYLAQSRPQDALAEMEQERGPEWRALGLALAYHALGKKKESDAALAKLIEKYGDVAAYQVAEVYGFRGEADRAFEWLDRAYAQRDGALVVVKGDPLLKSLQRDPRYAAFLKKMRLPT